jgi:ribosomal-protein-alanine N-acetyltransferase
VAALEAICFADPWSEKSVASELTNPLSLWLVAMDGERLAGYVGSQSVLGESDMMNVAVHPDYRRKGIAEALCNALIEALKKKENHCLTLEVRASNEPAKVLYEKLGFIQVGLRKNYYRNPKEDACILRKEWEV